MDAVARALLVCASDTTADAVPPVLLEGLADTHAVALALLVSLGEPDRDAVLDVHGVGDALRTAEAVAPLALESADGVGVLDAEPVTEGVLDAVELSDGDAESVSAPVAEPEGDAVVEPRPEGEPHAVADGDALEHSVGRADALSVPAGGVPVGSAVPETEALPETEGDVDALRTENDGAALLLVLLDALGHTEADGVAMLLRELLGHAVAVLLALPLRVGAALEDSVLDAELQPVAVGHTDADGVTLLLRELLTLAVVDLLATLLCELLAHALLLSVLLKDAAVVPLDASLGDAPALTLTVSDDVTDMLGDALTLGDALSEWDARLLRDASRELVSHAVTVTWPDEVGVEQAVSEVEVVGERELLPQAVSEGEVVGVRALLPETEGEGEGEGASLLDTEAESEAVAAALSDAAPLLVASIVGVTGSEADSVGNDGCGEPLGRPDALADELSDELGEVLELREVQSVAVRVGLGDGVTLVVALPGADRDALGQGDAHSEPVALCDTLGDAVAQAVEHGEGDSDSERDPRDVALGHPDSEGDADAHGVACELTVVVGLELAHTDTLAEAESVADARAVRDADPDLEDGRDA